MKGAQRATGDRRAASGGEVVSFAVPLPPAALRGNSRAHWTERKRAADEYSARVLGYWGQQPYQFLRCGFPWKRAAVEYEWRYAGARPDLDNVARAVKVLQDTLCCAPTRTPRTPSGMVGRAHTATDYRDRYFLGLIEDDGGIEPVTFKRRKVKTKAEEGVHVTIERVLRGEG